MENGGEILKTEVKANARLERSDTATAAWPCICLNEGYTCLCPVFLSNENKMQLVEYDDISKLLDLNIEDREFDELCLKAAWKEIEKSIAYCISQKETTEILTVRDNRIILNAIHMEEICNIKDLITKEDLLNFILDKENKSVYLVPYKENEHVIKITYICGYTKDNLPEDIKEYLLKIFLYKRKELRKQLNNEEAQTDEKMLYETKSILSKYNRKCL